jgi:hypothetical protein
MVPAVIVDDFHFMRFAVTPDEADPPPAVDPDAVLAGPIPFERLQVVAGRAAQIIQPPGRMHVKKLPARYWFDRAEARNRLVCEQSRCVRTSKGSDHHSGYDMKGIMSSITRRQGRPGCGRAAQA